MQKVTSWDRFFDKIFGVNKGERRFVFLARWDGKYVRETFKFPLTYSDEWIGFEFNAWLRGVYSQYNLYHTRVSYSYTPEKTK